MRTMHSSRLMKLACCASMRARLLRGVRANSPPTVLDVPSTRMLDLRERSSHTSHVWLRPFFRSVRSPLLYNHIHHLLTLITIQTASRVGAVGSGQIWS